MAITRPPWPPKIINLISAGLFLVLTLIGFLGSRSIDGWLFDWASGLVTLTIGLLLLVTMPIMPFTEQYARERVPLEYWGRPIFKKVNRATCWISSSTGSCLSASWCSWCGSPLSTRTGRGRLLVSPRSATRGPAEPLRKRLAAKR
jgi:hypothetical protein